MTRGERSKGLTTSEAAVRLLARRPLTERELSRRLEAQGHPPGEIDDALHRLREAGYLDDRRFAADFIVTRAERMGHGPGKLLADLARRGIPAETAEAALRLAVEQGDVDPRELLRSRIRSRLGDPSQGLAPRAHARMYNALRRAGFDEESIGTELEPYRAALESAGEWPADEKSDDLP